MASIRLAELHSFIVHFSIALLVTSVVLDFAALVFRRASLVEGASWALLLGAPLTVVALLSGWLSEHSTTVSAAGYDFLRLHKITAMSATIVFLVLFLARLLWLSARMAGWLLLAFPNSGRLASLQVWLSETLPQAYVSKLPRGAIVMYLVVSLIGVGLLVATGYLGEALVFRFGIGVYGSGAPLH
jgi:uncharacterized membrane protein